MKTLIYKSFLRLLPCIMVIFTVCNLLAQQPSYIRSHTYLQPYSSIPSDVNGSIDKKNVQTTVQYVDGLGRPIQSVVRRATPSGNDVIQPATYDRYGRDSVSYLPFVISGKTNGTFQTNAYSLQDDFYGAGRFDTHVTQDSKPFSLIEYESSPLNRVKSQMGPGQSWHTNAVKVVVKQRTNQGNDGVNIMKVSGDNLSWGNDTYGTGELMVKQTTDQEGLIVEEYTNKLGLVILKRTYQNTNKKLDTYYVYDDYRNLRFVIPPQAIKNKGNTANFNQLIFEYRYDALSRMIYKRVPGSAATLLVYDNQDRLVASQDGNQCEKGEWSFTKYDQFGRPALTGIYYGNTTSNCNNLNDRLTARTNLANVVKGLSSNVITANNAFVSSSDDALDKVIVSKSYDNTLYSASKRVELYPGFVAENGDEFKAEIASLNKYAASDCGYNNGSSFPASNYEVLTVTYYDNYKFITDGQSITPNYQYINHNSILKAATDKTNMIGENLPSSPSDTIQGFTTGSKVRILGSNQWLTTVSYYDDYGRVIQVVADNHTGGTDRLSNKYDFAGRVLATYLHHKNPNAITTDKETKILKGFVLDHGGRLKELLQNTWQGTTGLDNDLWNTLGVYSYNELGELKEKKVAENTMAQQEIDFSYNIRGWLKSINQMDLNSSANDMELIDDLFGMELAYENNTHNASLNQFNGNISGAKWKSATDQIQRAYDYSYDEFNRLKKADFYSSNSEENLWFDVTGHNSVGDDIGIQYDDNGNILALSRYGLKSFNTQTNNQKSFGLIDQLVYDYTGNGNQLKSVEDKVANQSSVAGDFIDGNTSNEDYIYDANGNLTEDKNKKISKIQYNYLNLPEHISFEEGGELFYCYDAAGVKLKKYMLDNQAQKTTDYIGETLYEDNILQFVHTDEGRALSPEAQGKDGFGTLPSDFVYEYQYKDHLGNLRVSFRENAEAMVCATMEADQLDVEETQFKNVRETVDNTIGVNSSNSSSYLNAAEGKTVGPFREFEVQNGDIIEAKTWARYVYDNTKSKTTYSSTSDIMGNTGEGFGANGINFGVNPFPANTLGNLPNAYLRIEVYDTEGNLLTAQRKVQYMTGGTTNWFQLTLKDTLNQDGFVKVFVANESDMDVWFDDVSITHQQGLIVQENHFYPFGMNLTGIEKKGAPDHLFQYNGKEKQEEFDLNWSDYGARFYDSQLGRFHTQDRFAEKYYDFTPYQYGANNPIKYIDVNGDSLWIQIGNKQEDKALYVNGNLYDSNGNSYNGKGVKKDGSYKGFLKKVFTALNTISNAEQGTDIKILKDLQESDNHFVIKNANKNPHGAGKNEFIRDDKWGASAVGLYNENQGLPKIGGSGGSVFWNPSGGSVQELGGQSRVRPTTNLAHELFHAYDSNFGYTDNRPSKTGLKVNEARASFYENQIRKRLKLPYREFYRTREGNFRILDTNNQPISVPPPLFKSIY